MDLSPNDIRLITRLLGERLGPSAAPEEIKRLAGEVANRLARVDSLSRVEVGTIEKSQDVVHSPITSGPVKKLIVNAFGLDKDGLEESIVSLAERIRLPIISISSAKIDLFRSVIAVLDYSGYKQDINSLKFEIDKLCSDFHFKALIQDSAYYGL
jgi:hypothetical protein